MQLESFKMINVTIDDKEVETESGKTIMQVCEEIGIEIPRFCYHERLSIAGNCRMCLVSMERAPKPVASCAMPVAEGMVIHTNTPEVQKMRKGVMEFLLINHPLDCPICDQGGECDLQDQAMGYGFDRSRFQENKRAVKDKYMGPLIGTKMTRCIHCTRCIRFASEVAGVPELGAINRGENTEIGTYIEQALRSELSGNLIDLCPVGALTSLPYAYNARSWELKKTESIDVMDAIGSNIRIDSKGLEVKRILPRLNETINEEWISDKARFSYDGLKSQRIDKPYLRHNGKLVPTSWTEAFDYIKNKMRKIKGSEIAAIVGDLADCESITALKDLMSNIGSLNIDCRQDGAKLESNARVSYLFNSSIAGIDTADVILLVGTNPRLEAPILNSRIRKRFVTGEVTIGLIGEKEDLTYDYTYLGNGPTTLQQLIAEETTFGNILKDANYPMLILGQGALTRPDGSSVLGLTRKLAIKAGMINKKKSWNGFNVLHTVASRVGALDLGFVPTKQGRDINGILEGASNGKIKAIYLLGADELNMSKLKNTFIIYQGHHGDTAACHANVVLPGAAYTEKNATYVNTEGRVQYTRKAIPPPGEAREDWAIIRALSEVLNKTLPYDSLHEVRVRMTEINDIFGDPDEITKPQWVKFGKNLKTNVDGFVSPIKNFYSTNSISRFSVTMIKCANELTNLNSAID